MIMVPTAEEFFLNTYFSDSISDDDKRLWLECNRQAKESVQIMIEFAKMHVTAALKAASEKAIVYADEGGYSEFVDEQSILNAYPLENIKQNIDT
jgi:hypothetical protein